MASLNELNETFEKCSPQLRSYLLRMTASAEDADDLVQETYVKAHAGIKTFKGESSLKTWLFSIGSNLARDLLRAKKRWPENVTDLCKNAALNNPEFLHEMMHIRMNAPQGNFEIREHISFCFTCISKSLPLEQQIALLLKEVYAFKVKEIAEIMDSTEAMVKYYLHVGRSKMIDIFDRRCALINKDGICHQCTELNGIFNPKQKVQEEVMKIEMAREAATRDKEQLFELRTKIVRALDPFTSAAATLQLRHLKHNKQVMDEYLKEK